MSHAFRSFSGLPRRKLFARGLRRAFPAHQLIGEESAAARAAAGLPPVALTVARQRPVETVWSKREMASYGVDGCVVKTGDVSWFMWHYKSKRVNMCFG